MKRAHSPRWRETILDFIAFSVWALAAVLSLWLFLLLFDWWLEEAPPALVFGATVVVGLVCAFIIFKKLDDEGGDK
jgi:putative flippase GtrA